MRRIALAVALVVAVAACKPVVIGDIGKTSPMPHLYEIRATPETIAPGESSTISWVATDATATKIEPDVGDVTGSTQVTVRPTATTQYIITVTGPGGTYFESVNVFVSRGSSSSGGASSSGGGSSGGASSSSSGGSSSGGSSSGGSSSSSSSSGGTAAPVISAFTASPGTIATGSSSTLSWTVTGATSVTIDNGVGTVTGRTSATVSPAATTTYTLTATGAGGTTARKATTVTVTSSPVEVAVSVDTSQNRKAISPYVYGYNAATAATAAPGATYLRGGGNRWSAYNWASNYSNAGADWHYSNDTYMGSPSNGPGYAAFPIIDDAKTNGLVALVTVPILGWVAKDDKQDVSLTSQLTDRFIPNKPRKGSAFTTTPSATSAEVYQDEFASFIAQRWGSGHEVHISLDNEPDLWGWVGTDGKGNGTHPEIQRTQIGYDAFATKWVDSAKAIRAAVPGALLYGPVSYGWTGYVSFQNAPDAPSDASIDKSFLDYFLEKASAASAAAGTRLLDAFDLHFYSEAKSTGCASSADDGVKIQAGDYDTGARDWVKRNDDCVVAARVQAPRSLWDPSWIESSWITQWSTANSALGQGLQLVPRMLAKIAKSYPGTKLSLSEYNHGGADHISGALAEADSLGVFGREGVWAAAYWPITKDCSWIHAAFRLFRNYDGAGKNFGDTSVKATSADDAHVGVYASVDAASDGRVVIVLVHRPTLSGGALDLRARTVNLQLTHPATLSKARAWQLTGTSTSPAPLAAPAVSGNKVTLTLPAMSVTTLELTP
jgi:hypothetical protein